MQKYLLFFTLISIFVFSPFLYATEGFLGENPGFDFYSKIDTGTYKIQQRLVAIKVQKSGNFYNFWRKCSNIKLIGDAPMDEKVLQDIENQQYGSINVLLKNKSVSTDQFHELVTCLAAEYKNLKKDVAKEQGARETVASIGLYADGDKSNSDYDIIYDIERINQIIFSTEIKYKGSKNISSKSLTSLLSGNGPKPLLPSSASIVTPPNSTNSGSNSSSGNTNTSNPPTIDSLLGSSCTNTGITGPVDIALDESFVQELGSAINGNANNNTTTSGYSASNNPTTQWSGTSSKTSAGDFFNKMPCPKGSMFCIDVKTVPGGNITLWGGKNVSIEWIVDTFTKHLLPISESSLAYQKMTNNAGSFPIKNLKLWKSIGGLRIYLGNQPQPTRRDKDERTPGRDEAELKAIVECGYIAAWLPTDMARANSVGGMGYVGRWITNDDKTYDVRPLWVAESVATAKLSWCMNEYMTEGRQTYYNSLSTDLTEIQAFTISMIQEIRDIMSILEPMNDKPVK
jgi:hypothetical protein